MTPIDPPLPSRPQRSPGFAPGLGALVRHPWFVRTGFMLLVCLIQSTHLLAQPDLLDHYSPTDILLGWWDYLVECLCYGIGLLLGAVAGEQLLPRFGRSGGLLVVFLLMTLGAVAGGLASIAFYGVDFDYALNPRFVADTVYWIALGGLVVLIYALQRRSSRATARLHRARIDSVALQKQTLEAQLQVMRAQIEPHFLFNTLANAKRLCQTDLSRGLVMLDNLVSYLRAALPQMRGGTATTLGQEADLVRAFLEVLAIRMGNRLSFDVKVPPVLREQPFPAMMLLTLVENAIKHGLNPAPDGGTITVSAECVGNELVVNVADNGVGFGVAATGGTGIGLANTRSRLQALYGPRAQLSLAANTPNGVVATIRAQLADTLLSTAA